MILQVSEHACKEIPRWVKSGRKIHPECGLYRSTDWSYELNEEEKESLHGTDLGLRICYGGTAWSSCGTPNSKSRG